MKTIFLFIPNYVYSSDLLRTSYISYLCRKFRVIVFAPLGLFVGGKPYFQSPNLTYIKWDVQYPKFWIIFGKFLRYCLIRKYDFEPVVQRNREAGLKLWQRKLIRPFAYLFPKNWIDNGLFTRLEVFFLPKSKTFSEYLKKYQPTAVVVTTPGFTHFDAEVIILAKKFKIPTVAIDFSWDNLHNGGMHFRRTDYLIVWNDIIKNIAVKQYGYSPEKVFVSGIIRFDHYFVKQPGELSREEFLKSKKLDPQEKVILITTVTKGNYTDEDLILEKLLETREKRGFDGYPNIFVRLHPKEEVKKFTRFIDPRIKNLCLEKAGQRREIELGSKIEMDEDDLLNLKYTLMYADVNINYLSTVSLEAFVFDKPVVNINYPEKFHRGYTFSHYKPLIEMNSVRLAYSFEQLTDYINQYFKNPELERANREKAVDQFIKFRDGLSFKRSVDFLKKII